MTRIPRTELDVFPLCLGGNVFGWTADEAQSFTVLDAYTAAGGNFIDTADAYSAWVPGNSGGESETILGRWLTARGNRDDVVLATKVGYAPGFEGLSAANIAAAADTSLKRLNTDYIDLYYVHFDDQTVPLEETLGALNGLVEQGKVRYLAASNFTAPRLAEALAVSAANGFPSYVAVQPRFHLLDHERFPAALRDLLADKDLACLPYLGLADGFLTGKYRKDGPAVDSARVDKVAKYFTDEGWAALAVLDQIAAEQETTVPAVALAWLLAQPTVTAPIASARTPDQLAGLLPAVDLELTADQVAALNGVAR
ncbi:MAG TPA: aldo/keto reductase [Amycolatopsis sp.]|nr:aldo/keto reductase [Amycolatopsis sp.]